MSKTKGNVIDPIEVITKYGTDAVRFTLASQASPGTDIAFSEARTEGYRAFANKIWNAARFVQMQIDRAQEAGYSVVLTLPSNAADAPLETRWILARLNAVCKDVGRALANFRFDEAANAVYQFFWGEFCDWYVELVKLRLDYAVPKDDTAQLTLNALVSVFEAALRLLSPFMPFLTEELWHALYGSIGIRLPAESIALTRFPVAHDFPFDANSVMGMDRLQQFITTIRNRRKELGVPEKEPVGIFAVFDTGSSAGSGNIQINNVYIENEDIIRRLARVSEIERKDLDYLSRTRDLGWISASGPELAVIYERQIDVAAERERLKKELAKFDKGLQAAEKQLNNPGFVAKAPTHIIDGLKKQAAETRALKEKAEAALAALPPES